MKKRFNTTGVCIPEKHYMVDISNKTAAIFEMIQQGDYFVINRPRQYGKTTTIYMLDKLLKTSEEFFPIKMSFEGIGSGSYQNDARFIEAFMLLIKRIFKRSNDDEIVAFIDSSTVDAMIKLDAWITDLVMKIGKKTVLMIDEVDKSSNNQLFLDFLGMLRDKYLRCSQGEDVSFHSVILAGVHDVRNLVLRAGEEAKYYSPWNIAVDFEVDLSLLPGEIALMLEQYAQEQKVSIDIPFFSQRLFYFTSGYPFLVSYLCKIIDEKILPGKKKKEWSPEDLDQAFQIALTKDNTNFESLIKNLENNPELYEFVFQVVMNEGQFSYNLNNPIIHRGVIHGVLKEEQSRIRIHNRLYEQRIYNYMTSKIETRVIY
jgi:hypothetical protein